MFFVFYPAKKAMLIYFDQILQLKHFCGFTEYTEFWTCSKSEYVIYKLKEMGKVSEKDVMQVSEKFDRLDAGNCGKITLADLMEPHN